MEGSEDFLTGFGIFTVQFRLGEDKWGCVKNFQVTIDRICEMYFQVHTLHGMTFLYMTFSALVGD